MSAVVPVFLVTARRSGSTLFRLMLKGHPQVAWQGGWEPVAGAITSLDRGTGNELTIEMPEFPPFTACSHNDLKQTLDQKIEQLLAGQNRTVFGATCHVGFSALVKVWPTAKFIHLVRDPRDIAMSNIKLGWAGHFYFAAETWAQAERDWEKFSAELPTENFMELRYEELVASPEAELRRICEFLEIEYTDKLFDYVSTSPYSYPKKTLAYRWRKKLKPRDVQLVESRIRPLMSARGYKAASPCREYPPASIAIFKQRNLWGKRLHRIRHNGLLYVMMDKTARSLDWTYLKDLVARIDATKLKKQIAKLEKNY